MFKRISGEFCCILIMIILFVQVSATVKASVSWSSVSDSDVAKENSTRNGITVTETVSGNDVTTDGGVVEDCVATDEVVTENDVMADEESTVDGATVDLPVLENDVEVESGVSGNDATKDGIVSADDVLNSNVSGNDISTGDVITVPEGVIAVSLPTEFKLTMFYESSIGVGFIQSQDIVMINESDFPVNIDIRSVQYYVNREQEQEKEVELSMVLKQHGQADVTYPLKEEEDNVALTVLLEEKAQGTDTQKLQQKADTTFAGTVESADYAVINFKGTMGKGNWKDGDIKVQVVYEIARVH